MGLMQKAYETFEKHRDLVGLAVEGQATLTPVFHSVQNADIEITLDSSGRFKNAEKIEESRATVIPSTEESAGRSGAAIRPHPLCDQLKYIAPIYEDCLKAYITQLTQWTESPFSHPKACAVLKYVKGQTILPDLVASQIIKQEDAGGDCKKIEKLFVRWRVVGTGEKDATYEDTTLFNAFQKYYQSELSKKSVATCMLSGERAVLCNNHPKGVVAKYGNAKLISANDSSGFTYRGRFTQADQALTVGYEASQKAHSALQWVVANQGVNVDGRTFVCWNPSGKNIPNPAKSPLAPATNVAPIVMPSDYRKQLRHLVNGYMEKIELSDDAIIAAFDAATSGRLSVTYYNEMKAVDFLRRIEDWQSSCFWENGIFGFQSPSIKQLVLYAFGTEQRGSVDLDGKILREHTQQLFHCVVDGVPISQDIVQALFRRASTPLAYTETKNRRTLLFVACAAIFAYRTKQKKEEWNMALEPDKQDRSYQFGRLLAVMEKIERDTYDRDENREPNAIRLQSLFCERPIYAARIINDSLTPYFAKLSPAARAYYKRIIGEIWEELSSYSQERLSEHLEDSYLLGYYLQRNALYQKKNTNNTIETEE